MKITQKEKEDLLIAEIQLSQTTVKDIYLKYGVAADDTSVIRGHIKRLAILDAILKDIRRPNENTG